MNQLLLFVFHVDGEVIVSSSEMILKASSLLFPQTSSIAGKELQIEGRVGLLNREHKLLEVK
jgi:hypothetical protein